MASIEKYTNSAVLYELRHNTRENPHPPKNVDIDPTRTKYNYYLKGTVFATESKQYYNKRKKELYCYGRADVKTLCGWVITVPADLPKNQECAFFTATYDYLNSLYGEKNCIQCVVHYDEGVKDSLGRLIAGRPHMHYMFIPAVKNKKYMIPNLHGNITKSAQFKEKICADSLINRSHLKRFHSDYQKYLNRKGFKCTVHSGITGGNNKTVEQLKSETKQHLIEKENEQLKDRIHQLEAELVKAKEKDVVQSAWGEQAGWDSRGDISWEKEF